MPVQKLGEIINAPEKFKTHLMMVLGTGFGVAVFIGYFFDQRLSQFFGQTEVRKIWWLPAREITNIGLSENYFGLALICWIFTRWFAPRIGSLQKYSHRVDYFRRWALNFLMALTFSGVLTHIIKAVIGRQRPHKTPDFDPLIFKPLTFHWDWNSFASGHSQVMFTAATMMAVAFPRLRWIWLTVAIIIASTRFIIHDHFLSDTIFGACLGYVGSLLALRWMKNHTTNGLF